jgi:hypothetical protein
VNPQGQAVRSVSQMLDGPRICGINVRSRKSLLSIRRALDRQTDRYERSEHPESLNIFNSSRARLFVLMRVCSRGFCGTSVALRAAALKARGCKARFCRAAPAGCGMMACSTSKFGLCSRPTTSRPSTCTGRGSGTVRKRSSIGSIGAKWSIHPAIISAPRHISRPVRKNTPGSIEFARLPLALASGIAAASTSIKSCSQTGAFLRLGTRVSSRPLLLGAKQRPLFTKPEFCCL